MKIKILQIRTSASLQAEDENTVNEFLLTHNVLQISTQLITQKQAYWSIIVQYTEKKMNISEPVPEKYNVINPEILNADELKLLESLKLWRSEKAKVESIPHYMIASNKELVSLVKFRPAKKEEMTEIKGFGKYKIENFGNEIIEILEAL